jgi:hypothetical protein
MVPTIFSRNDYPEMVEEAGGRSIPIIYGQVEAEAGALKCMRVDTDTYLLAAHHCKSLESAFREDGTDISGNCQLINHADGNAYILYDSTEKYIKVNAKGKMDAKSALMDDPIDAIKDIIDTYSDMEYNIAALDEAQAIMQDREYKISAVIDKKQDLKSILVDFCFSFDCDFYIGRGNEITITLLKWSKLMPKKSYNQNQLISFHLDELPEEIKNKVQYKYNYNSADEIYQNERVYAKESSIINWGEFYNRNEPLHLKYVSDNDCAFDVVQRFVIQRKNPRRVATLDIPLTEFLGVDIADIISIHHPNAIDPGKRKYQVRRVNIDFNADIVQVEAMDITSLTGGVFILGNRQLLHKKWNDAEDNERNYGYLADNVSGYFSNNTDYGKVMY